MIDPTRTAALNATAQTDRTAADQGRTKEVAKQFEAVFLTDTVQQMLKNAGQGAMGTSNAERTWNSFLAEAIAKKVADSGTTGIAQSIERMIGAYQGPKA